MLALTSDDFAGYVTFYCPRCKPMPSGLLPKMLCRCGRWLHNGRVDSGSLTTPCGSCRCLVRVTSQSVEWVEVPYERPKPRPSVPVTGERIAALIEERWTLMRRDWAFRRTEVAVGIRFDVFNRDAFRCQYCGIGVTDGALLEVDHVIARANGGPDTLDNLVTACQECNRGKSAKSITKPLTEVGP